MFDLSDKDRYCRFSLSEFLAGVKIFSAPRKRPDQVVDMDSGGAQKVCQINGPAAGPAFRSSPGGISLTAGSFLRFPAAPASQLQAAPGPGPLPGARWPGYLAKAKIRFYETTSRLGGLAASMFARWIPSVPALIKALAGTASWDGRPGQFVRDIGQCL